MWKFLDLPLELTVIQIGTSFPDSKKSISGYIVMLGNSPMSWKYKKQAIVSLSYAEAEYRAIRMVVGEIIWLRRILEEFDVPCTSPIPVYCDSETAIHIARNPLFHECTKHRSGLSLREKQFAGWHHYSSSCSNQWTTCWCFHQIINRS